MQYRLGSVYISQRHATHFCVWAPERVAVAVKRVSDGSLHPLHKTEDGYWQGEAPLQPGELYLYTLDHNEERPDPASRHQPNGVHGPSQVVRLDSIKTTDWKGFRKEHLTYYELHVGTFTEEGTFDSAIEKLDHLVDLGITCVEIMPVAAFPGERNWGYDGVYPFAVQASYGGPGALRRFVDACHERGLAVCLDVVYNHFGPEGNYLWSYGPYFTDRYHTPWGNAINFDGPYSDQVRHYFLSNAAMWFEEYDIDILRLDAVHAIYDDTSYPFLEQLQDLAHAISERTNRERFLIAESDSNDPRLIRPKTLGGFGMAGQWADCFHHSVHALLTGETNGYYQDFGEIEQLAASIRNGYTHTGQYLKSRKRRHGRLPEDCTTDQFVVCIQNHDQVGNRMLGDRFGTLLTLEQQKLAAAVLLLSPFTPLLFMGEEYGETNPFLYFVDHGDPQLIEGVREGRKREFAAFHAEGEPPDPTSEETFRQSKLDWGKLNQSPHSEIFDLYKQLLQVRRELNLGAPLPIGSVTATAYEEERLLTMRRGDVLTIINFSDVERSIPKDLDLNSSKLIYTLGSGDKHRIGAHSLLLLRIENQ